MCGIAGFVNSRTLADEALLRRMTDSLSHRGPDGSGTWIENNVALGHRRLSIIDLSDTGSQPMVSHCGRFVLSYNGEIFNFAEIRAELVERGHHFKGKSDTEVLLNALSEWGVDALLMLNGMFAFALWDRESRKLLLARDRFGIKPVYYSLQGGKFYFASEQKAIISDPGFRRNLDVTALREYFTFQNFLGSSTLMGDISLLPPGSYLEFSELDQTHSVQQYWDLVIEEPSDAGDKIALQEELARLFSRAVERQMQSDVEVGAYLSGGLDSASIVALASQLNPGIKTFTVGFDLSSASGLELGFDERERAEALSAHFGTEQYEVILKSGDMERAMDRLSWHLEEPRVGQSYPNLYAANLASRFVKVVLSGAGGDELFAGYPWRYESGPFSSSLSNQMFEKWNRLGPSREIHSMFLNNQPEDSISEVRQSFDKVISGAGLDSSSVSSGLNMSLYFEFKTFLPGLLVVEDKLSMAFGLESRVPFLDNDLVDFARRCPSALKIRMNHGDFVQLSKTPRNQATSDLEKRTSGKAIFRDALTGLIPERIINLPKQGFSSPDASWFRGASVNFVKRVLTSHDSPLFEVMDRKKVLDAVGLHLEGKENRRLLIWSLLNLDFYLRKFH